MFRARGRLVPASREPVRLSARFAALSVPFVEEPSLETSRRTLAGAVAAALLLGGGGFLLGRATTPSAERSVEGDATQAALPLPAPTWAGPLSRPDLISLASLAADTTAAGMAPDDELVRSEGRRFEIRLPFGCDGPAAPDAAAGWSFDEANRALRVFIAPVRWSADNWLPPAAEVGAIEAIEGFWIERPWTSSEACPKRPPAPDAGQEPGEDRDADRARPDAGNDEASGPAARLSTPPPSTFAIGQVHTSESSRSGRREGDAYRAVVRVAPDELDTSQGFRLRISGRLAGAAGPAPVICRQADPAQRPVCLLTAAIDEIAIENPATGETLATWTLGQRSVAGAS